MADLIENAAHEQVIELTNKLGVSSFTTDQALLLAILQELKTIRAYQCATYENQTEEP